MKISIAPPRGLELENYLEYFKEFNIKVLKPGDTIEGVLILAGGPDIGINTNRDQLELDWIKEALEQQLPILGICRGMQLLNVFFGGEVTSLDDVIVEEHRSDESFKKDEDHDLNTSKFHFVKNFSNLKYMLVNSRHHQYCSKLAENFTVTHTTLKQSSPTEDVIAESFIDHQKGILGVQWHPERQEYGKQIEYNTYPIQWLKQQLDGKESN